jgi:hypothetical protein
MIILATTDLLVSALAVAVMVTVMVFEIATGAVNVVESPLAV